MIRHFDRPLGKNTGNKGNTLMLLKQNGFNVPNGFVLNSDMYDGVVRAADIEATIDALLNGLSAQNVVEVSEQVMQLFDGVRVVNAVLSEIQNNICPAQKYAVRSSGSMEDSKHHSFAGQYQTFLNVQGLENIEQAILGCYKSMFSVGVLSYLVHHKLSPKRLKMAVIIQEMVDSECSGIAFTINPVTGNDKEIVVEVAPGLGEDIVSGKVKPEQYLYNWYEDRYIAGDSNSLLSKDLLNEMMRVFLDVQVFFGYPCDIEFAVSGNELHILQARAVTGIQYSGIQDIWTTADFKDGGVSATVCTPYMWSLYEYIWEYTLRKFLVDSKILAAKDCEKKLGDMFYGRPYWNLSVVKKAMSNVPGYKERAFDEDYGVKITYEGHGATTGFTVSSLYRIIQMAIAQKRILKDRKDHAEKDKAQLLDQYDDYRSTVEQPVDLKDFEQKWYGLTRNDYLKCESTYFWQIFINAIHQSMIKDTLMKHVSTGEYLGLLSGIDQISHLRPFYDLWETSRKIRQDQQAYAYWTNTAVEEIQKDLSSGKCFLNEVSRFIELYGYHSDKELDVTYPCYYEDPATVIRMFKDHVGLDDSCSPVEDKKRQKEEYTKQLQRIKGQTSPRKYKKLKLKTEQMRRMLWWREEFRDVSTRFYYIIRMYTVKLAERYVQHGVLEQVEDIWMLKIAHIWDYIDGALTRDELREIVEKNRTYYQSFRNCMSENEIGSVFDGVKEADEPDGLGISGVGCNNGTVTGTARVIEGLQDIERLQQGDILVTKFTDTGWTCKFAMISGIITEYGGILCHAAIVSREYGIPCIVAAHDAMQKIQDGSRIMMDGTTGMIKMIEE